MFETFKRKLSFSRRSDDDLNVMPPGAEPIESALALLSPRVGPINTLMSLAGVPEAHFNALYLGALERFAIFVQTLPSPRMTTSILDSTLEHVVGVLSRRRGHLLPPRTDTEHRREYKDIWTYAAFTAALLPAAREVFAYPVSLYDDAALSVGPWDPWHGPMVEHAARWYQVDSHLAPEPLPPRGAIALLAPRLLPAPALEWLVKDPTLMRCWLSVLTTPESDAAAPLRALLEAPDSPVIRAPVLVTPTPDGPLPMPLDAAAPIVSPPCLVDPPTDAPQAPTASVAASTEKPTGRTFFRWLKAGIADGSLAINDKGAHAYTAPEGLVLACPGVFEAYAGLHAAKVQRQFVRLPRVVEHDGQALVAYRYNDTRFNALVVPHSELDYPGGQPPTGDGALVRVQANEAYP